MDKFVDFVKGYELDYLGLPLEWAELPKDETGCHLDREALIEDVLAFGFKNTVYDSQQVVAIHSQFAWMQEPALVVVDLRLLEACDCSNYELLGKFLVGEQGDYLIWTNDLELDGGVVVQQQNYEIAGQVSCSSNYIAVLLTPEPEVVQKAISAHLKAHPWREEMNYFTIYLRSRGSFGSKATRLTLSSARMIALSARNTARTGMRDDLE